MSEISNGLLQSYEMDYKEVKMKLAMDIGQAERAYLEKDKENIENRIKECKESIKWCMEMDFTNKTNSNGFFKDSGSVIPPSKKKPRKS